MKIAILPGDGIGTEIVAEAVKVLNVLGLKFESETALVGGDGTSLSIAAASIIAKVGRDRAMLELDRQYPEYGFAKHKGYPTAAHFAKLRTHGPCPIHRRSFAPVAQAEFR